MALAVAGSALIAYKYASEHKTYVVTLKWLPKVDIVAILHLCSPSGGVDKKDAERYCTLGPYAKKLSN
jgi:hypothetical protein